ncbi:hypothetical protein [Halococcus agarilyticus]|uniref:hypothetical protein n=1 Tax=Halococcus agarilyticus TaxID=1232219 RepID=UPI0006777208|nr:hypothetical protein [Halococcus agarilyticus]
MSPSSAESRGFFAYYREYARSGVHAASAAALTAFGLLASVYDPRFVVLAIAVYVLPPVFLYFTGEGERVPSVVGDEDHENRGTDGRERERERSSPGSERSTTAASTGSEKTTELSESTEPSESQSVSGASQPTESATGNDPDDEHEGVDPSSADAETGANRDIGGDDEASPTTEADPEPEDDAGSDGDPAEPPEDTGTLADDIDSEGDEAGDGWHTVESPTDDPLTGVVATHGGAFAVGENGVVLARGTDGWELALEDGPSADGESLRGIDATDDGQVVWFAGDGGALGRYDVEEDRLTDHSAPKDQTSTWTAVAVVGRAGEEHVHLANGSGEMLQGAYDDGEVDWGEIHKPGSGSSITDLAFDADTGYACDSSQGVYATTDGASYETIGIDDANTDFAALAATDTELVVAGGDGTVFRYDGSVWTTLRAGETALRAIDLTNETGLAAGDAGGVFERADGGWTSVETSTDADLRGVLVGAGGPDRPDVAVGTDGTIVERNRS